jgi:hypothetical protein
MTGKITRRVPERDALVRTLHGALHEAADALDLPEDALERIQARLGKPAPRWWPL